MLSLANRGRALRILCLEDDTMTRKLIGACLDVVGAEVIFAVRGGDAVQQFRRHPVDLVLLEIDGDPAEELAAFEGIRHTVPRGRRVPVLALTANDCRWRECDYLDAGFDAVLFKPVEPTRLFAIMDTLLRRAGQPPLLTSEICAVNASHWA